MDHLRPRPASGPLLPPPPRQSEPPTSTLDPRPDHRRCIPDDRPNLASGLAGLQPLQPTSFRPLLPPRSHRGSMHSDRLYGYRKHPERHLYLVPGPDPTTQVQSPGHGHPATPRHDRPYLRERDGHLPGHIDRRLGLPQSNRHQPSRPDIQLHPKIQTRVPRPKSDHGRRRARKSQVQHGRSANSLREPAKVDPDKNPCGPWPTFPKAHRAPGASGPEIPPTDHGAAGGFKQAGDFGPGDEEEEIGLHMWGRRGRFAMPIPWFQTEGHA